MKTDYIQTYNDGLEMIAAHTRDMIDQKKSEIARLETFLAQVNRMAATESIEDMPTADLPAFLRAEVPEPAPVAKPPRTELVFDGETHAAAG